MKILSLTLTTCLLITFSVSAQVVADRTNSISLDFSRSLNTILPEINWEYPRQEYTNSEEGQVEVKATVKSTVPLKSVRIAVKKSLEEAAINSKPIDLGVGSLSAEIGMNIFLTDGQNYLEIIAENDQGGIVKDTRSILIGMDALKDAIAIDRKDYALLFATDRYDNWGDLVNPINDAETIGKELTERYGFDVEIVKDANQDDVFNKLRQYAQRNYKPQDQLFIFFAGHGQYDETFGEGYIVAKNSLQNDQAKTSYISHNRLRNNINNIPTDHIFLAMDVCFGGTFDAVLAGSRAAGYEETDDETFIVKKLSLRTRKYLTSGSKEYVSDGIAGQHSPFARKFLEALKSNGGGDRILTLTELNLFMERIKTTPRFGDFGDNDKGSDFLFLAR